MGLAVSGIAIVVMFSATVQADVGLFDIGPHRNSPLQASAPEVKKAAIQLAVLCDNPQGIFSKNHCDLENLQGLYSPAAISFCGKEKIRLNDCLAAVRERDFSEAASRFCQDATNGIERIACAKYFSTTPSYFQKEALEICQKTVATQFFSALRPCLDQIRDRQFDKKDLTECKEANGSLLKGMDSPKLCMERLSHKTPISIDKACQPNPGSSAGAGKGSNDPPGPGVE